MRALVNLAELACQLGYLATARALFDEGAELAQRAGLGWSLIGIRLRWGSVWSASTPVIGTRASGWPPRFPTW
jgi:hypothetical protein